ncbi:MAG: TadE family protein [Planctomycetota bacterium]
MIVELAIVLPILVLLVFGSIELNRSIFLKQTLTSAALDGVLVGLRLDATEQDVIDRVNQLLADRNVNASSIEVETESGFSLEYAHSGERFTVVVTAAPENENIFLGLTSVNARITGVRP